jgi:SpoVK/Ycf46/Vps4 family AAA+-type ATPase
VVAPQETGEYNILRCINQHSFWKTRDSYNPAHFHPNCLLAAERLLPCLDRDHRGVFFLHGAPGLGKTTTARFMAKQLDATLCLDFEEFSSFYETFVHSFEVMYDYVQPTAQHPLVVTLDELEGFILHNDSNDDGIGAGGSCGGSVGVDGCGNDKGKSKYTWKYKNTKKRWVRLMDSIQEKHHVVFVLTSNLPKSFFDAFDPALLREYRITHCLHYTPEGVVSESLAPAAPPMPAEATPPLGPTRRTGRGAANKKGRN